MHALIIEDDALTALAIEDSLQELGFTSFDFALSADQAVTAAARRCPDLITADVKLGPGCGIDAVKSICSARPVPVLFITGSAAEVRARMPLYPLVPKPFTANDVKTGIRLVLDGRGRSSS